MAEARSAPRGDGPASEARFSLPGVADVAEVAEASALVLARLHLDLLDAERGAPGLGFGE